VILTKSVFLACVDKGQILSLVMLPNTIHIKDEQARLNIKNKLNDVLAFHSTRKVTSGPLTLTLRDDKSREVHLYATSPFKDDNSPEPQYSEGSPFIADGDEAIRRLYAFQKSKKRFHEHDLMNDEGEIKPLHPRQLSYLNGQLITHCWAAVHKGHVVGLIAYPVIHSNTLHDNNFERYKSLARIALQTIGYVVACDLVLNHDHEIEIYNIHREFEKKDKLLPYFTRIIPHTAHLQFKGLQHQVV
jgi:hypothetical protein